MTGITRTMLAGRRRATGRLERVEEGMLDDRSK
jgi:hypothetical protein